MTNSFKRILIVAGEASGDIHGEQLVRALKKRYRKLQFFGMGGAKMRRAGVETFFDIKRTGAMGLFENFGNIFYYLSIYRELKSKIENCNYDAIILIDYPTLNLRLAAHGKRVGCPVYYFISPQIWAWRKTRIRVISQRVKKMFVVLPFEEKIYREADVDVEFVGHPFVELVKPELSVEGAKKEFGLSTDVPVVGLLPGSRVNEVNSLLDTMLSSAEIIKKEIPNCQFILPVAETIKYDLIQRQLGENPLNVKVIERRNYDAMNVSDCLVIASGSATLEAGILGRPMVIVYKLHPLTHLIAKWLVEVDHFGLINLTAGERVVPELLQREVTPDRIAKEVLRYLKDPQHAFKVSERLLKIRYALGKPGVAQRTANAILGDLGL